MPLDVGLTVVVISPAQRLRRLPCLDDLRKTNLGYYLTCVGVFALAPN